MLKRSVSFTVLDKTIEYAAKPSAANACIENILTNFTITVRIT